MNFFRRNLLVGSAAAAGLGGFALAARGHGRRWHRGEPWSEARFEKLLQHFYVEVEATEEQKQRLAPVARDAVRELRPMLERAHSARREAIELLTRDPVDRGALERLRAEHVRLADEASRRLSQALADAAEVLTPAQREGLAQHWQRRMRG
jgi:Spy/CpxP family protein refolding chaperone